MNKEMVIMVESIAREKDIPVSEVWRAVEESLAFAVKKMLKGDPKIVVHIDEQSGEALVERHWQIVDDVDLQENLDQQVLRPDAPEEYQSGKQTQYVEVLDVALGRQAAQMAKQAILNKLKDIEQHEALVDFDNENESLVYATVKGFQKGNVLLDIGRLEALLPKSDLLPKDQLKPGSRIRVSIERVEKIGNREVVFASRTSNAFMQRLLELEVSEIEDGGIEIVKLVRAPGMRTKILIKNHLPFEALKRGMPPRRPDAVRLVLGNKWIHAKNIAEETGGEHLDVIVYDEELPKMVSQALHPAQVSHIVIDEEIHKIEVTVPEESMKMVIGSKGHNIRLIGELLGWEIEVMTPEQWESLQESRAQKAVESFMSALDVDEDVAIALVEGGFSDLEDVGYCEPEELGAIEGFDEDIVLELQTRAKEKVTQRNAQINVDFKKSYGKLKKVEGITDDEIEQLVKQKILTPDDLADLATDELQELLPHWKTARCQILIMNARHLWDSNICA